MPVFAVGIPDLGLVVAAPVGITFFDNNECRYGGTGMSTGTDTASERDTEGPV